MLLPRSLFSSFFSPTRLEENGGQGVALVWIREHKGDHFDASYGLFRTIPPFLCLYNHISIEINSNTKITNVFIIRNNLLSITLSPPLLQDLYNAAVAEASLYRLVETLSKLPS